MSLRLAPSAWKYRVLATLLILGAAGLHLVYLACNCPLDLAPDEAHYWDWSRHLDWSYYSKGPLVAWIIRASCEIAGAWSGAQTGNLALAVRLPAILCGSLLLASLYVLTVQVYRRDGLALAIVGMALTVPMISVGSSLMTIDAPYTCCWGWALVLGHRAVFRGSAWAWPLAGLLVGLGILAKYTMVLWVPSLGLFLLTTPQFRGLFARPGFWVMAGVAALCCTPILVWNAQHDWVTVRHVLGLSGVTRETGPRIHWLGPLAYLGGQCALLLVYWFVAWAAAMIRHRPWTENDLGVRYLWWLSAPMFLVFLGFSFKTGGGELNWPVTAYLSGLVLAAEWLSHQLTSPHRAYRRLSVACLTLGCGAGLLVTVFMHHSDWLRPVLARVSGSPTERNPYPLRRFDPTCRLRGWRTGLAAAVDRERARLQALGIEPVLAGCSWNMPGELGMYCAGHPQAYSIGPVVGDRHSQYDFWPNPVADPDAFRGRTFVIVGGLNERAAAGFDWVEPPRMVTYREGGAALCGWVLTVGHGFHGFPPEPKDSRHPGF